MDYEGVLCDVIEKFMDGNMSRGYLREVMKGLSDDAKNNGEALVVYKIIKYLSENYEMATYAFHAYRKLDKKTYKTFFGKVPFKETYEPGWKDKLTPDELDLVEDLEVIKNYVVVPGLYRYVDGDLEELSFYSF